MKQKIIETIATTLYLTSLFYVAGQYGALECRTITCKQFIVRAGIGLVFLIISVLLSNMSVKKKPLAGGNHTRGKRK